MTLSDYIHDASVLYGYCDSAIFAACERSGVDVGILFTYRELMYNHPETALRLMKKYADSKDCMLANPDLNAEYEYYYSLLTPDNIAANEPPSEYYPYSRSTFDRFHDLNPITLGERIRALRRLHHITTQELADSVGRPKCDITSWEKCLSCPTDKELSEIADFLYYPYKVLADIKDLSFR